MADELFYKKSVGQDLKKLSKGDAGHVLDQIELVLSKDPKSNPALKGKFAGLRRFRVGDYRVIYAFFETELVILKVGHRLDVYKNEL